MHWWLENEFDKIMMMMILTDDANLTNYMHNVGSIVHTGMNLTNRSQIEV